MLSLTALVIPAATLQRGVPLLLVRSVRPERCDIDGIVSSRYTESQLPRPPRATVLFFRQGVEQRPAFRTTNAAGLQPAAAGAAEAAAAAASYFRSATMRFLRSGSGMPSPLPSRLCARTLAILRRTFCSSRKRAFLALVIGAGTWR